LYILDVYIFHPAGQNLEFFPKTYYHYEKFCPSKPDYPATKTKKKLIYNYCATIPLALKMDFLYDNLYTSYTHM
jgi:hypothetical protein